MSDKKTDVQDGQDISIEEDGREFRVAIRGESYRALMATPAALPAMDNPKALAAFALVVVASMLSKELLVEAEKSALDGAAPTP